MIPGELPRDCETEGHSVTDHLPGVRKMVGNGSAPNPREIDDERTTEGNRLRALTAVVERCSDTHLYVGYVPGFPGAHSQGETMDELATNLKEVIEMLVEEGESKGGLR